MPKSIKNQPTDHDLLVIGIGASAGGLEALQDFFKVMPLDTGMAFVVVQHLSPDYKSLMDELLARQTKLRILIIEDGMQVEANTIYLIPPRKNLTLFHSQLFLEDQSLKRGLHLPVDIFFSSLASEMGKNAIGIILSGTGSDGTLGTRAIKEAGGMIMVQDETTAKFDGMPRSSISTGLVDYILPPSQMPEALVNYTKHPFVKKTKLLETTLSRNQDPLTKVTLALRDHTGIDFSYYKENTVIRRLERRLSINRFETVEEYLPYLNGSEKEKETLFREMLIGVTRFFRDAEAFAHLEERVIPVLCKKKAVRIWSAGCSTGEEVYSIAILFLNYLQKHQLDCDLKIFATDIDRQSLDIASRGFYSESMVADVDPQLLTRFFYKRENGYQVSEAVRKAVVFASHNLLKDPPFSKLDLLVCRNLFIYFKPDIQQQLLGTFYHSLAPAGYLFMGSSESIGELSDGFTVVDNKWKLYQYKEGFNAPAGKTMALIPPAASVEGDGRGGQRSLASIRFDRLMSSVLSVFMPPSIILDSQDNIIHTINDTTPFLKIQPGRFTQNLYDNLSHDLGLMVSSLLRKLKKTGELVVLENLVGLKEYAGLSLALEGRVIVADRVNYYLMSFRTEKPVTAPSQPTKAGIEMDEVYLGRVGELEKELQFTKESLQATVEELETSNEELQSSNEELIASNEELQSTNEELQSVNEELYTVNSEYQNKIEELTRQNNDETNLLRNTEIGAIYLDKSLCIRKVTPVVSAITNIMPSDLGRPIEHISVMAGYPEIQTDILSVVETLQAVDREVQAAKGQYFMVNVRPYRTGFNAIEGILITFVEITKLKEERRQTEQALRRLEEALRVGNMAWWEWDVATGKVIFDPRKATMIGYTVEEFPATVDGMTALIHPEDYQATMKSMEDHLYGKTGAWVVTYRIRCKDGSYALYSDRGQVTERDSEGRPLRVVGTVVKVTDKENV